MAQLDATHTYIHRYTYIHVYTHKQIYIHTHTHIYTHVHTHTCTYTHACSDTYTLRILNFDFTLDKLELFSFRQSTKLLPSSRQTCQI